MISRQDAPAPAEAGRERRKPGKQRGAPGAYLAWNDDPDRTVDLFPEGTASAALTWTRPLTGARCCRTR